LAFGNSPAKNQNGTMLKKSTSDLGTISEKPELVSKLISNFE